MGEKSNRPIDPLADLFSNVQLTGLSKPKNKRSTLEPLQIDLPVEMTERTPPVLEKTQSGLKQPKSPPRYLGEEYDSAASDVEIEEMDSDEETVVETPIEAVENEAEVSSPVVKADEKKSQIDVQTQIQIAMLQQKMHRQRLALKKKQEAEQSNSEKASSPSSINQEPNEFTSVQSASTRPQVEDSLAKLNNKLTQQKSTPSAMDLFLAAAAENEQTKRQPQSSAQSVPKTATKPNVQKQTIANDNTQASTSKPLMGNRLMLRIEEMIRTQLPLLKEFHVASALDSFDRPLMRAIWRSHRTKFLMSGQLEYAVAALSVIDAFEHIEEGQLVAAYVETTASDYLIWVDLPHQRLVAAFADAKSYFASK